MLDKMKLTQSKKFAPFMLALLGLTSCAQVSGAPKYAVATRGGPVLIDWSGEDVSYNHSNLDSLIRKGVEQAGAGTVVPVVATGAVPAGRLMLRITENGPRGRETRVAAQFFEEQHLVASATTLTVPPGSAPRAVFIRSIAETARRVLPAAG
jgi:hypothetical protein